MTSLQNLPIYNNLQGTYKFKIHNFAKFTSYNFKVYNLQQMNITKSKNGQRPKYGKNGKKLISIVTCGFNEDTINVCVVLCIAYD